MGFFEDELQKIFGKASCIRDARFTGRACVGRLGETTNEKIQFVTTDTHEQYEALKVTVFNRCEGVIDANTFRFSDIWGTTAQELLHGRAPSIRTYDRKTEWYYCQPNTAEYRALAAAVNSYLEVFLDQPEKTREAEKSGDGRSDSYTSILGTIEEGKRKPRQPRKSAAQIKKNEQEL